MFKQLMALLRNRRLLLSVSLIEGEIIRATVVPQKATRLKIPFEACGSVRGFLKLEEPIPTQCRSSVSCDAQTSTNLLIAATRKKPPPPGEWQRPLLRASLFSEKVIGKDFRIVPTPVTLSHPFFVCRAEPALQKVPK